MNKKLHNLIYNEMWFHYSCEDPKGSLLRYGRCWFKIGKFSVNPEWKFGDFRFAIGINHGAQEDDLKFSFCIPGISFYLSLDNVLPNKMKDALYDRKIWNGLTTDIRIFEWAIWWNFRNNDDEWSPKIPKWQNGNFNIKDFFLGKLKTESHDITGTVPIEVVMPEKAYEGTAKRFEVIHNRSRWFTKKWMRTEISVEGGIPHPGKGTCEYNCGEDALFSISVPYDDIPKACKNFADSVLDYRERYPL